MTEPKKWSNQFGSGNMGDKPKSHWGKKLLGGQAGLKFTAKKIVDTFPHEYFDTYVEPFAGKARTAQVLLDRGIINVKMVLNDISPRSNEYCRKTFPSAIVENMSFEKTMKKYDGGKTFFFIDPPWRKNIYTYNDFFRIDRKVVEYYQQLLTIVENLKGDWMITSNANEVECRGLLSKSKYNTILICSGGKHIFGKQAKTLLCSNLFGEKSK
mgnify:CR=1 FL=1|jgi:site-specific DNA-adenine methylase|tara:strand:+ start:2253 stop:2888 length:636 start_codon:yes stop_codon:yes gene_type:complete